MLGSARGNRSHRAARIRDGAAGIRLLRDPRRRARDPDADPDGYGTFSGAFGTLAGANTSFCWGLTAFRIGNPTAAHIHQGGPATANGPIRILLNPPPSSGLSGRSANCQQVTDTLANQIKASVAANVCRHYINVHNSAFPGGAVRGQLFKASAAQDK